MTRVHLEGGHDVLIPQFAVRQSFFDSIDSVVADTSADLFEVFITADANCVAERFRTRRASRTAKGGIDVAADIPSDQVGEAVRWALAELAKFRATRRHAFVMDASGELESTLAGVCELLDSFV